MSKTTGLLVENLRKDPLREAITLFCGVEVVSALEIFFTSKG